MRVVARSYKAAGTELEKRSVKHMIHQSFS